MPSLTLKPTHKPIKAYDAAIKQFDRLGVTHETAVRSAFQSLLEYCARQFNLTLVPEHSITVHRNKRIIGEWEGQIDEHLNTAHVVLLLISSDFMASDYCYDVEMKRAMERHEAGETRVIPVILRPVFWRESPFRKLLGTDGQAVTL